MEEENKRELKINESRILLYQSNDGTIKIDVRFEDETVWLSQSQMGELFGKDKRTISEHIGNIFKEGELEESVVVRKFRITTQHGAIAEKTQKISVNGYNLDVIISAGYRVKSFQGTQFRIWATQRLHEYIVKGFVLNDERFKSGIEREESLKELENDINALNNRKQIFRQQTIIHEIWKKKGIFYSIRLKTGRQK
jgi:hypothetical protein